MSKANAELIHRWFEEVWNQKREEAIREMMHRDARVHGIADIAAEQRGPDAFIPFWRKFTAAFPDLKITVLDTVAEGEKVAARCLVNGNHTGAGLGIAPTNSPIEFTGICILHERDGKVFEGWNNFDFLALFQQLGIFNPGKPL
jgi:predicted ester cyclase